MTIRRAGRGDRAFLAEMLYEAAFPPGVDRPPLSEATQVAHNWRFLHSWPSRPGDIGVVAVEGDRRVGAAWCRIFRGDEVLSAYSDPSIPELAIAIVPDRRGQGVGKRLLAALSAEAQAEGFHTLDLVVGVANEPAVRLYRALGFVELVSDGRSMRMRRDLTG